MKFDQWAQRAAAMTREIAGVIDKDPQSAFRITKAALHALRDRLTVEESRDLAAQLPMFLKAVWADGWDPTLPVDTDLRTLDSFLDRVLMHPANVLQHDMRDLEEAERCVRGVFNVVRSHISAGEAKDVSSQLPQAIRDLWEGVTS